MSSSVPLINNRWLGEDPENQVDGLQQMKLLLFIALNNKVLLHDYENGFLRLQLSIKPLH